MYCDLVLEKFPEFTECGGLIPLGDNAGADILAQDAILGEGDGT